MPDAAEEYRGFSFWLVETKQRGVKAWRIEFPEGHRTPPILKASAAEVKEEIDRIIAEHGGGGGE